jgi:hypothetical protein
VTSREVSLVELDCDDLPTSIESAWYKAGRDAYDYLLRKLEEPNALTDRQIVNIMMILSRMRFADDPEVVRGLLLRMSTDSRTIVRSRAVQYLVGTMRSESLVGRDVARARPEYLEAARKALTMGVDETARLFVAHALREMGRSREE